MNHTTAQFRIRMAVAALFAVLIWATPATAQQTRCGTGYVAVYIEEAREFQCLSESQLRTINLRHQQRRQIEVQRQREQQAHDRLILIQRQQQRLPRTP